MMMMIMMMMDWFFCPDWQWRQRECNFGGDAEGIKEQL